MAPSKPGRRVRGLIETLPSGSLRVKVYAGVDPVSKKRLDLEETIPAGPRAAREAEKARTRLLAQVDERRNPRTRATVNQLLDRYLTVLKVEPTTRGTYEGYIRNYLRPVFGPLPLAKLEAETVELTRAAGALASLFHARATTATIRRQLINVPARPIRSGRRIHLRLPMNWPWADAWLRLFTAALEPPAAAAA